MKVEAASDNGSSSSSSLNEENHHFCWVGQKGACLSLACQRGHVPVTATAHQRRLVGEGGGHSLRIVICQRPERERTFIRVVCQRVTFSIFVSPSLCCTDFCNGHSSSHSFPLKWRRLAFRGRRLWPFVRGVNFSGMLNHFIPFDSPWTALQICY